MIQTIPIVFHGGCYGTYLEWVLYTLTTDVPIEEPFTNKGNSHQYLGGHINGIDGWRKYLTANNLKPFVRLHPKLQEEESVSKNLDEILNSVNRMIYIYPDEQTILLTINNAFTKIWDNWWALQFEREVNIEKIYTNWPETRGIPVDEIPTWVKREFLSFYLVPQWQSQVEWNHLETWSNDSTLPVTVSNLLYNFENTISTIKNFCGLTFTKSIKELLPSHTKMLSLQTHTQQDQLAHKIIDSLFNQTPIDWSTSLPTLATESWIQWQLRNLGYEIRCNGLDIFPTNTVNLHSLIYKNNGSK